VCAPALADGSGPLSPFPITGAYTAQQRVDRDHISVIDLTGNYDRNLSNGQPNAEPRAIVSRAFLKNHPDDYDFIVTFSTFNYDLGGATGFEWGVQNHVKGIGLPDYDNTALFGSQGKLHGFIDMGPLSQYSTDPLNPDFEKVLGVLAHEMLHAWGIGVHFKAPDGSISDALLGRDNAHWSYLADTDASVEYGAKWRDNGDGTFTLDATYPGTVGDLWAVTAPPYEPNLEPVAVLNSNFLEGTAGEAVEFDGSQSYDEDGVIANYAWDFGDGNKPHPQCLHDPLCRAHGRAGHRAHLSRGPAGGHERHTGYGGRRDIEHDGPERRRGTEVAARTAAGHRSMERQADDRRARYGDGA
ncbi:MAG: PKD domain-containing protein, partial [Gammaproteobacteria bacterium]